MGDSRQRPTRSHSRILVSTKWGALPFITYPAQPGERVIINFHGGGFVAQSAHPSDLTQNIDPEGSWKQVKGLRRVLSVEYRLSTAGPHFPPANPFPAALLDAVSAYNYVVSQVGFKPDDIILMGDSAGANLALALTRYLLTGLVPSLRPPKGLILNSPWVDLGPSHLEGPMHLSRNSNQPILSGML